MGKKLDRLLGRSFKLSKFKPLASLAVSRLAVLRKRSEARLSQARSDVAQLLELAHHDRALLRVEQVVGEQNTLDVYALIEGYCHLLIERVDLIEREKYRVSLWFYVCHSVSKDQTLTFSFHTLFWLMVCGSVFVHSRRVCPDELKEAASSLVFAASRCGDFPELHEMRVLLSSRYGKEFAASAVELRNNCAVNPTLIQRLSTRQPSLESRTKLLKEIAATNGIALPFDEPLDPLEGNTGVKDMPDQPINSAYSRPSVDNNMESTSKTSVMDEFSDSFEARSEYQDVAEAAQAAFVSAAYAAAAARAAVELSRSESFDPDDQNSPSPSARRLEAKQVFDHNERQLQNAHGPRGPVMGRNAAETRPSVSSLTSDSGELTMTPRVGAGRSDRSREEIYFDRSDDEECDRIESPCDFSSPMQIPSRSRAGTKAESGAGGHVARPAEATGAHVRQVLDLERRPMSVRSRHVRGY
ncbi:uncharacterized protein LOC115756478 isoform X1 [Rhodamnia argentea]|uniref:Uncharacterized protein LOC115756478 isoform X1 n=1 Tax=Rhodamnia argentea TaxID=178133 RepID=A0A8B8QY47_9MYRT|nr:uncharacterized protein LOC115756478 isoform X1 [Rhodamnia argentea]